MSLLGIDREGSSSSDGLGPGGTYPFRPRRSTGSGRVPVPRWASPWWLLFLGLAVAEVVALGVREHRVPAEGDWRAAADAVRAELKPTDAITVAPGWADPLLRLYLGDSIPLALAGRSDLAAYERLWVLAIRGARAAEAPPRAPDFQRAFGRVSVERYDLGPSPVVFDLAAELPKASVARRIGNADHPCPLRAFPPTVAHGGLGGGVIAPERRFQCDEGEKFWLWVGTTTIESLDLSPHRCIWTHPQGNEPISITYKDVPLASRLVLYAGLDYHDERDRDKGPVSLRVLVDGREVSVFTHRDGDGMARYELALREALAGHVPERAELRFEVTSPVPFRRSFCWTGTVQREPQGAAR